MICGIVPGAETGVNTGTVEGLIPTGGGNKTVGIVVPGDVAGGGAVPGVKIVFPG